MPRPNKPGQGYRYGNGGRLDLGDILASIYGGVEINPDFGKMEGSNEFGPAPLKKGAEDFYKPRSIFDRARASEMNAARAASNIDADNDIQRQLNYQQNLNPILKGRAQDTNNLQLDYQKALGPITATNQGLMNNQQLNLERAQGIAKILQALGMEATPENIQTYNEMNTPALQETAAQKIKIGLLQALGEKAKTEFANQSFQDTRPDLLNKVKADAFYDAGKSLGQVSQLPLEMKNREITLKESPLWKAAEAQRNQFIPVGKDTSLFDTSSGKLSYDNGIMSKINSLNSLGSSGGSTGGSSGGSPSITGSPQQLDPNETVMVNGRLYRKVQ
jgi:hypothetical protein